MATEIEIDTIINTAGSASGLKYLRKSLKELVSLQGEVGSGSDHFKKLQKTINETEGKLSDLTDSFQTLRGSGVERLNSSFGLLREGLSNADPGKLKIAFEGLTASMKAIPIFLLIEGVKFLFDNIGKVVDVVKTLTGSFSDQEKEVKRLTKVYDEQVLISIKLNAELDGQIALLKAQKAPLSDILELETKRFNLKEKDLLLQRDLTKARLEQEKSERSLTETLADQFGVIGTLFNVLRGSGEERVAKTKKTAKELAEIEAAITKNQTESEVNKINTLKQIEEKAREEREKRIAAFQEFLKTKTQQEIEIEQDRINVENKLHEEEIEKVRKQVEEEKALRLYIKQSTAEQEQQIEDANERKRRLKRENQIAFENAFVQKSLEDKIKAIEQDRETQLLNEQLTQSQRIDIIRKAEDQIFKLKVQKGQEYVNYAQQVAGITNSINQLITQNENYELQQQQYAKDAAILNDQNRTQEELDREELRKNTLLNNASLTASERERIAYESETRQKQISKAGREAQNKLTEEFNRKELAIKKEQFERNKKLQIVTGVINTAATVLQTLASTPYPANIPLAILAGAAGAVQVGIIASQKFDDGGASARSGVSALQEIDTRGGLSSGGSPVNKDAVSPTSFDLQGNVVKQTKKVDRVSKVIVLESEIRDTSERVDVLEDRRTFGE